MSELQAATEGSVPHQHDPLTARVQVAQGGRFPVLPRTFVPRARLWARLDEATLVGITLLVAPTGAGKTLGVAGWLLNHHACSEAVWISRSGDLSPLHLTRLKRRQADSAPRLVVIDDAHDLSPACLSWLDEQLQLDPEGLRLVLLSRWDLPLTRLVPELLGHLTILRGDLLRLDADETADLVAAHVRGASDQLIEAVAARGQGWCAAVVLASRTIAVTPEPLSAVRSLETNFSAMDQVAREAFASLISRQRHVLLCVASEGAVSVALARHLSNDAGADSVLEELTRTGLLVMRQVVSPGVLNDEVAEDLFADRAADDDLQATYQVHPLLAEVTRRRMEAGGVDVERARSTIRRAVAIDINRGQLHQSLRRLLAACDHEHAVRLLATHGVRLVLSGDAHRVNSFAREHADLVEAVPACWFALALARWHAGSGDGTRYWLERLVEVAAVRPEGWPKVDLDVVRAHLMLALLGAGSLREAVDGAPGQLSALAARGGDRWPDLALLQLLIGIAQLRLGALDAAAQNLSEVALDGGPLAVSSLSAEALSELAVSEFLQGRENAVLMLARRVPETPEAASAAGAGLRLVTETTRLQTDVEPGEAPDRGARHEVEARRGDGVTRFLGALLESRRFLLRGQVADAAAVLDTAVNVSELPVAMRVALLVEKALVASLGSDRDRLKTVERQLTETRALGEAALVAGLRADLDNDLTGAIAKFSLAAERSRCRQPAVAAFAATCRAQLLDSLDRREEALSALERAVVETAARRNVLPFLGWIRHGTPVSRLLDALVARRPDPWAGELAVRTAQHPMSITGMAGPVTATPQERERIASEGVRLGLTARERDVLHELARGSTYSGIAANLFVSENTVKTHVSSLYAKLGVARRSDALAVARTLRML
ncbi:MAG TPA: LuxR C-terminal-related transcriptional regulator [Marmoricola sp.]|nr:LuxR C-terminal-related transcriptional regulator [Marmoricola sp.]